jgi:hypothetical protein
MPLKAVFKTSIFHLYCLELKFLGICTSVDPELDIFMGRWCTSHSSTTCPASHIITICFPENASV